MNDPDHERSYTMAKQDTPTSDSTHGFLGDDPKGVEMTGRTYYIWFADAVVSNDSRANSKVAERTESTYDAYNPGASQRIDERGALRFRHEEDDRQQFRDLEGEDF
jgi:hypothetical protein